MLGCVLAAALLLAGPGAATSDHLRPGDELYFTMPKLFHLDDMEECLASPRGAFCLGTFELQPSTNEPLFDLVQRYSTKQYFNHTKMYRGICVSSTCSSVNGSSLPARFQRCVADLTEHRHGLGARLAELSYCRSARRERPVDTWDVAFASVVALLVLINVIGTLYDVLRNKERPPIKQLEAWSVIASWRRLTAAGGEDEPRRDALRPIHGMKAISLIQVLMAHSALVFYFTYLHNPQFLEKLNDEAVAVFLLNGSHLVQVFFLISGFLLAYNLLLHAERDPKTPLSWSMLPKCIILRILRITPVYMFMLGVVSSWWAHAGDGPLWRPLIEAGTAACRGKWWAHALYVNNFVQPDVRCLPHTWYLAVDMQMLLVCCAVTLAVSRRPRAAVKLLAALILAVVLINFIVIWLWDLEPIIDYNFPETIRGKYKGVRSFTWQYSVPWSSLPSALTGVLVAFKQYNKSEDSTPADSKLYRVVYRASWPAAALWIGSGYVLRLVSHPLLSHAYAAVERPVFTALVALLMYGLINKVDSLLWKFSSWRAWQILGRLSLSIYLVHWLPALTLVAARNHATEVSISAITGHWFTTIIITYSAAVPLHLLVEVPIMRFLQSVTLIK
ncbi:uncharacterized protein LOC142981915 [Anticarsia gemmatalis]|uniref:uncharacterized protein LOC142981915 n=1 Tax=Anticarsia gemmatalis TaxID=129554 RepID=UPI003F773C0B